MIPIAGYADRWSVGHNESIEFKVSSELNEPYSVRLVRMTCADPNPDGPGIIEHDLSSVFSGQFPSRKQPAKLGSYGFVPVHGKLTHCDDYTVCANIWPTMPNGRRESILCMKDSSGKNLLELYLDSGHLHCSVNDQSAARLKTKLQERRWYEVWCSVANQSQLSIGVKPIEHSQGILPSTGGENDSLPVENTPSLSAVHELFVASDGSDFDANHFNGKIEHPGIFIGAELVRQTPCIGVIDMGDTNIRHYDDEVQYDKERVIALWDFSIGISTQKMTDVGNHGLHGKLVNCPTRAMRGSIWSGREMAWKHAPGEYAAIHFHDDDLYDCNWETDFKFKVPDDFRSAMYSMRIECQDFYEDIPFYVRPKTGQPQSKICVLVPTFTYTVYINQARSIASAEYDALVKERGTRPWTPDEYREYGLSTYNYHTDGSGICYSSRLRPAITMRPNYITISRPYAGSGMRHLPADTHLLAWLEHMEYDYDVITDDDLHQEGGYLLEPYRVVMTMSHPEYHTSNTLDALFAYTRLGGRLMYMGGNGFYWKVGVNDEVPGLVEIRRAEGGIRIWAAEPGEYYNALDGEYGGMWLRNGRPPQQLAGVGFTGQGDFQGMHYRKKADVPEEYQWVFNGIDDEILGDFGLSGGGAAGFELDRIDYGLGTPRDTVVLASSETYHDHFVLVPEEILSHQKTRTGDPVEELIRSDMVIFETEYGGKVFSVGSITYCGSLPWNGFDNNISQLTQNVLENFLCR